MKLSPTIRISLALVLLTNGIFLLGDLAGLSPDERSGLIEGRRKFCEYLAIHISSVVGGTGMDSVEGTLRAMVERNADVLSVAVRDTEGGLLAEAGDHSENWNEELPQDQSTANRVQVPIFNGDTRWGTVEIAFAPITGTFLDSITQSSIGLMLFVAGFGFCIYWIFIRKALRELDPGSAIPERVRSAFNALAEGLLLMDEKEHIILANDAFAEKVQQPATALVGLKASSLGWDTDRLGGQSAFPWLRSLNEQETQTGIPLVFESDQHSGRMFMVNTAPIFDSKDVTRGVLATFNDMTALERKHTELKETLKNLRRSEEELRNKTLELEYLATRDPLTGCLNRRAFLEKYDAAVNNALNMNTELVCIMLDIDHFKLINDQFGHITGDKVIQIVAEFLRSNSRPADLVGRYGGEEFCIVLPETGITEGIEIADRLRGSIAEGSRIRFTSSMRVTASFGVASLSEEMPDAHDLVNRADKALYAAKEAGRNRVIEWEPSLSAEDASNHVDTNAIPNHDALADTAKSAAGDNDLRYFQERIAELEGELGFNKQLSERGQGIDKLTGLPNRLLFADRIHQALARTSRNDDVVALISLDIDAFKRVNDALGHVVGDQLLKTVAERLVQTLRSGDTVAFVGCDSEDSGISRIGSDEFGILVTDLTDVELVTWIVKRIFESLSQRIEIDGHEIFVTCSAGVSVYPHDAFSAEALLQNASAARNDAKHRFGRNNLRFFSPDINKSAYRQLWLETQLHNALENGELSIHYQPQVDIKSMQIRGLEALLRWQHPKLGSIPPSEFIPIAESTGVINEIGEWALHSACQQMREWLDHGFSDLIIGVNLSGVQMRRNDLADKVMAILKNTGLPGAQLELEITETTVMENIELVTSNINRLRDMGVRFAVDDFGTGYSSLSCLKDLNVDSLKLDRGFLTDSLPDRQGQMIVSAMVALSRQLGLRVVAEGVETETQRAFLRDVKCAQFQGFVFSKALPAEQISELLHTHYVTATESAA